MRLIESPTQIALSKAAIMAHWIPELGLVIDSPALAQRLAGLLDLAAGEAAYEVRLREDGEGLVWIERTAAGEKRHDTEPGAGWFRRFAVGVYSALPIDWML